MTVPLETAPLVVFVIKRIAYIVSSVRLVTSWEYAFPDSGIATPLDVNVDGSKFVVAEKLPLTGGIATICCL